MALTIQNQSPGPEIVGVEEFKSNFCLILQLMFPEGWQISGAETNDLLGMIYWKVFKKLVRPDMFVQQIQGEIVSWSMVIRILFQKDDRVKEISRSRMKLWKCCTGRSEQELLAIAQFGGEFSRIKTFITEQKAQNFQKPSSLTDWKSTQGQNGHNNNMVAGMTNGNIPMICCSASRLYHSEHRSVPPNTTPSQNIPPVQKIPLAQNIPPVQNIPLAQNIPPTQSQNMTHPCNSLVCWTPMVPIVPKEEDKHRVDSSGRVRRRKMDRTRTTSAPSNSTLANMRLIIDRDGHGIPAIKKEGRQVSISAISGSSTISEYEFVSQRSHHHKLSERPMSKIPGFLKTSKRTRPSRFSPERCSY